jgi:hypothetical protein
MRELWYVKARNVETGEEIQRIAAGRDGILGSSDAELEMKAFLVGTGRAKPDFVGWKIVEVRRVGEASQVV